MLSQDKPLFDADIESGAEFHVLGRNEKGQLGLDHADVVAEPKAIARSFATAATGSPQHAAAVGIGRVKKIEDVAAGPNFSFFYNADEDTMMG